jgi:riboflavin synthase
MFSGIIKAIGTVESVEDIGTTRRIQIASSISDSLTIDQSIAHNGVCLTVIAVSEGTHTVEVVHETLSKTSLGHWSRDTIVNLEKSITPNTLLDGHMVQGHVDTTVRCSKIDNLDGSWKCYFDLPADFAPLVISHGSICINGVSLTIAELGENYFAVAIIPYTFRNTNFRNLKVDDQVNIEFDVLGKYIVRLVQLRSLTE